MTTPRTPCRLIVDSPADGAWNMALDEALLDAAAKTEVPTLRLYQWQSPTLSLGYFQQYADREQHEPSCEAEVVRRMTGGGAILHDRELTYSLFLPSSHPLAQNTQSLYEAVHHTIIQLLSQLVSQNDSWQFASCEKPSEGAPTTEPFLCFQRRSPGDVLLQPTKPTDTSVDYKVVGSAQRRRRGAVLQHGSVLLSRSRLAPELPGINEVLGENLNPEDLAKSLATEIGSQLRFDLQESSPDDFHQETEKLLKSRYASGQWSRRR